MQLHTAIWNNSFHLVFIPDVFTIDQCSSAFNPRHACAARVTVVGSVCLSVFSLINGAAVHPENDTTYSMGNESPKICLKMFCSKVVASIVML